MKFGKVWAHEEAYPFFTASFFRHCNVERATGSPESDAPCFFICSHHTEACAIVLGPLTSLVFCFLPRHQICAAEGEIPYRVYTVFSRVLIYLERTHCFYLLRTYGFALTSRSVEMDLDMIQDLLGGTNLPPPPSVQDLLGDVVPVARSPTPPTPPAPQRLTAEHSYSKVATFIIGRVDSFLCVLNSAV